MIAWIADAIHDGATLSGHLQICFRQIGVPASRSALTDVCGLISARARILLDAERLIPKRELLS